MTIDLFNRSVTRLFIAEAERKLPDGQARPSFLLGAIDYHMVSDYINCLDEIPKDHAGGRDIPLLGNWGKTNAVRGLAVEVQIGHGCDMRYVSANGGHETKWFSLFALADVFAAPARTLIVVGSKEFTEKRGPRIAARVEKNLPQHAVLAQQLVHRLSEDDDFLPPKLMFAGVENHPVIDPEERCEGLDTLARLMARVGRNMRKRTTDS